MAKRREKRSFKFDFSELCAQPGDEDGIDPATLSKGSRSKKPHRKDQQLCSAVRRTLDMVLGGECRDERLQALIVQNVQPAPDASRLLVTLQSMDGPCPPEQAAELLVQLGHLSARLRAEVARVINRSKTPQLSFQIVQGGSSVPNVEGRQ